MGSATQLVFPSAVLGSAFLAIFAFLTTAGISPPPIVASSPNTIALAFEEAQANESSLAPELTAPLQEEPDQGPTQEALVSQPTETPEPQIVEQAAPTPEPQPEESSEVNEDCKLSQKYPDKIRQWCQLITKFSNKNGLDPDLIAALIWQESGGNPTAYSKSGAVGLMQVMPRDGLAANFMCVNGPCFTNRPSIAELEDPSFNIKYGTGMLANLIARYGDVREALRYYGPRDVGYYYADKVLGIYANHRK